MRNPQNIILDLFKQVLQGSSTESIKQAEQALLELEKDNSFLSVVMFLLDQNQIDFNLRKFTAVYISKFMRRVLKENNPTKTMLIVEQILAALASSTLTLQLKPFLLPTLDSVISLDNNNHFKAKFVIDLVQLLQQSRTLSDEEINFEYLVFFGLTLMGNPGFSMEVAKFINLSFADYVSLSMRIQKYVVSAVETNNSILFHKIIFLLREYTSLLRLYMKRFLFIDFESSKLLFMPELQTLLSLGIGFTVSNNALQSSLFVAAETDPEQVRLVNSVKANYINILHAVIKILTFCVKEPKMLALNPVFNSVNRHLNTMILAMADLLRSTPYYKLQSLSILLVLDEILSFMSTSLRINTFYSVFQQHKERIIEDLIFRLLDLNQNDMLLFYEDSDEFVNQMMHMIGRDIQSLTKIGPQAAKAEEIKEYETLRTNAREFLGIYCKFQDGMISELFKFALLVLENQMKTELSKSLMLIIICILRDLVKDRKDIHMQLADTLMKLVVSTPAAKKTSQGTIRIRKQTDFEYVLVLIAISKYYDFIKDLYPNFVAKSFAIISGVLIDPASDDASKQIVLDIIEILSRLDEGETYSVQIITMFNNILKHSEKVNLKITDSYYGILKFNDDELKKRYDLIIEAVQIIIGFVKRELEMPWPSQMVFNKCWNVVREIGESQQFLPALIVPIEQAILPILPYIDGIKSYDFEEDILMLMSCFIKTAKSVDANQQLIFEIIPRLFYNQYKATFGHAFETMQLFIFYGKDSLKSSPLAIEAIIKMCLTSLSSTTYKDHPLTQIDNCEGVLLLQSLVLSCGQFFTSQHWIGITQTVTKRLKECLKMNILKSNLIALLSLILANAYKIFGSDDSNIILNQILSGLKYFQNSSQASKLLTVGLNELMVITEQPFIEKRFSQILDSVITLLQITSIKTNLLAVEEEEDDLHEYSTLLLSVRNSVKTLDQYSFFKLQIEKVKKKNLGLLQRTLAGELPASKLQFLKNVMSIERVMNEPRQIFKIKRN